MTTLQKLKSATAIAMYCIAFTVPTFSYAQTIVIEHDGNSAHGVVTDAGTITAKHVGGLEHDFYSEAMDIIIDTDSKSESGFTTSDKAPKYFIDRRGTRHQLNVIGNLDFQTLVSIRFYFGESGMPVFGDDGSVVGIVLGNAFIRGRWRGRISRVTPIVDFSRTHLKRCERN